MRLMASVTAALLERLVLLRPRPPLQHFGVAVRTKLSSGTNQQGFVIPTMHLVATVAAPLGHRVVHEGINQVTRYVFVTASTKYSRSIE